MQQLAHVFYAMAFLLQGTPIEEAPSFSEFQRRFWSGEIKLTNPENKGLYGRVHWERLRKNMSSARFGESIDIVSSAAH